jgi:hypothetical protein
MRQGIAPRDSKSPPATNIGAKRTDQRTYRSLRASWRLGPERPPWSGHAVGRSRRLRPKPCGRRPSTAAVTISGARKASGRVVLIERSHLLSREAKDSKVSRGFEGSSSSRGTHEAFAKLSASLELFPACRNILRHKLPFVAQNRHLVEVCRTIMPYAAMRYI